MTGLQTATCLDYVGPAEFLPAIKPKSVGLHSHRSMEAVSLLYQGEVEHILRGMAESSKPVMCSKANKAVCGTIKDIDVSDFHYNAANRSDSINSSILRPHGSLGASLVGRKE
jgi:hypothetical protein